MAGAKKKMVKTKKKKLSPRVNAQTSLASASLRYVRISPRRARLALDMIRGKQVDPALQILKYNPRKGSRLVYGLLQSAIANAKEQHAADIDRLWVTGGFVNAAPTMKRYMPCAHGRAEVVRKRSSHITILLNEK